MGLSPLEKGFETPSLGRSHQLYTAFRHCSWLCFW